MRFEHPLLKLPIRFCAETLAAEIRALPASAWMPHPNKIPGNDAVPLVTPGGRITDRFEGPMAPTEHLLKCPAITQVMAEIGGVWGRSRLMGLGPGAQVPRHVDINYYWRTHVRIHIPIITNPGVLFTCGEETVHMAPGEAWVFDSFRMHDVQNRGTEKRIHLVLDTVPGERLWSLIDEAQATAATPPPQLKPFKPTERPIDALFFEQLNSPRVISPWEIRCHIAFIRDLVVPHRKVEPVFKRLDRFAQGWASVWARFGDSGEGVEEYQRLIAEVKRDLQPLGASELVLSNEVRVEVALQEMIFLFGGAPKTGDRTVQPGGPTGAAQGEQAAQAQEREKPIPAVPAFTRMIERPVFVVSAPRSGSTLLIQMLMLAPRAYTVGRHPCGSQGPRRPPGRGTRPNDREDTEEQLAGAFFQERLSRGPFPLSLPRRASDPFKHDGGLGVAQVPHLPRAAWLAPRHLVPPAGARVARADRLVLARDRRPSMGDHDQDTPRRPGESGAGPRASFVLRGVPGRSAGNDARALRVAGPSVGPAAASPAAPLAVGGFPPEPRQVASERAGDRERLADRRGTGCEGACLPRADGVHGRGLSGGVLGESNHII